MKNIHVLPTNKPSRLQLQMNGNFHIENGQIIALRSYENIYITSDEEIKEGDWFYLDMSHSNTLPDEIHQMGNDKWSKTGGIHFCEGNTWVDSCKKIILTTDQDLIKDGVQAIDDEFLEWFVKNPSCEYVKVNDLYRYTNENTEHIGYKIIIPKEEPKTTGDIGVDYALAKSKAIQKSMHLDAEIAYKSLSKQETIEEAAKRYSETHQDVSSELGKYLVRAVFRDGAKWQQEQYYNEQFKKK